MRNSEVNGTIRIPRPASSRLRNYALWHFDKPKSPIIREDRRELHSHVRLKTPMCELAKPNLHGSVQPVEAAYQAHRYDSENCRHDEDSQHDCYADH